MKFSPDGIFVKLLLQPVKHSRGCLKKAELKFSLPILIKYIMQIIDKNNNAKK